MLPMANSDPLAEITSLQRQREELLHMQQRLGEMVSEIEAKLEKVAVEAAPGSRSRRDEPMASASVMSTGRPARGSESPPKRRPVRQLVLDGLEDLDWMAYSREVTQYVGARYGRDIPPTRFGSLAKDEIVSFQAGTSRPVWICYGLTHDRHLPIKRLLARSDWPLERRIVAPTSGRVQHLKMTATLAKLAMDADGSAAQPEMLRIIAADHARDLPGIKFRRGQFDLEEWREVALALLSEILPKDEDARRESAVRLQNRGEMIQLFGIPEVENLEPGTRERLMEG
jgi:hypothetical protein